MAKWDDLVDPARIALEKLITEGDAMADRIEELEAKLAKAVEGLMEISDRACDSIEMEIIARKTLAELTGGKDE